MAGNGESYDEIRCSCGDTFDTLNELYGHAGSAHGVEVE